MTLRILALAIILHIVIVHWRLAEIESSLARLSCRTDSECMEAFREAE